jgi:hypothetical protein
LAPPIVTNLGPSHLTRGLVGDDVAVPELSEVEAMQVRELVAREQFVREEARASSSFGDQLDVWERDGALVRLTRDRGQWWCDLSRRGWSDWFDVDLVAEAFGSKSQSPADRIGDVIGKFADDRLLEALRTYRSDQLGDGV